MGLAPSIVSADFTRLAEQLATVEPYATQWHVDVMDGHYVPNLTIGPMVVEAIATTSSLRQEVHLMITNPAESWQWYARAGAGRIAFHPETAPDPVALLRDVRAADVGPGVAVNPDVPVEEVVPLLELVDHVVVMSVHPGFSGQRFIPDVVPKISALRRIVDDEGLDVELIVDGGVNLQTAPRCVEAGAHTLVSASAIFGADDPAAVAEALRGIGVAAG